MQIAKGGISWIVLSIVFFVLFGLGSFIASDTIQRIFLFLSIISGLFAILFLVFFRDPKRNIGKGIVAVADGIIRKKESVNDIDLGPAWFISTFMNLYHVHVNRMPIDAFGKLNDITIIGHEYEWKLFFLNRTFIYSLDNYVSESLARILFRYRIWFLRYGRDYDQDDHPHV